MRYLCTSHARAPHIGGTILEPKLATPEPHSGPPGGTLSVEQAMRTARELYRRTLWECWPLALAAALVSTAMDVYVARRDGGSSNDLAQLIRVYSLPEVQALNLLQTVLSLAFFGGLIALQYDALVGRKVRGVRAAFATGFGRLGHAALISVLWCAMVVAGLLLLIVPGVYWSGALSLWPVALFAENAQGTTPLTYSRECVKGHWWAVSTVLSIATLGVWLAIWGAGWIADAVAAPLHWNATTTLALEELFSAAATVLALPFVTATYVAVYGLLRQKKPHRGGV